MLPTIRETCPKSQLNSSIARTEELGIVFMVEVKNQSVFQHVRAGNGFAPHSTGCFRSNCQLGNGCWFVCHISCSGQYLCFERGSVPEFYHAGRQGRQALVDHLMLNAKPWLLGTLAGGLVSLPATRLRKRVLGRVVWYAQVSSKPNQQKLLGNSKGKNKKAALDAVLRKTGAV